MQKIARSINTGMAFQENDLQISTHFSIAKHVIQKLSGVVNDRRKLLFVSILLEVWRSLVVFTFLFTLLLITYNIQSNRKSQVCCSISKQIDKVCMNNLFGNNFFSVELQNYKIFFCFC